MEEMRNRIRSLLCSRVAPEVDADRVGDDDHLIEDLNLDSLQLLTLIGELENEFQFELDDEDLDLQSFSSVATVAQFVTTKLAEKA